MGWETAGLGFRGPTLPLHAALSAVNAEDAHGPPRSRGSWQLSRLVSVVVGTGLSADESHWQDIYQTKKKMQV